MNFSIELPQPYRIQEVLQFHGRDLEALAESASPQQIRKGFFLEEQPVVLTLGLTPEAVHCQTDYEGPQATVERAARHCLALAIDPGPFEATFAADPVLGPLIEQRPGLRIVQTATAFEALTWAIMGQQINLSFAIALRRSFIQLAGRRHPSGLWCYPGPTQVAALTPELLGAHKFSRAKANALVDVARALQYGELPLEEWYGQPAAGIGEALLALKGIGPWTVNYTLLRGYADGDCSLHGDAAVKNALHRVLRLSGKPDSVKAHQLLLAYRPHRSLAAAHLWASLS